MAWAVPLFVVAGLTASGHVLLTSFRARPGISFLGDLVVDFLVGAGTATLLVFWVSLADVGAGLSAGLVLLAAAIPVALGLAAWRLRSLPRPRLGSAPWWLLAVPPLLVLAADTALLGRQILRGDPSWDGVFVWEIKARVFASAGGVPAGIFADLSRLWSHPNYPFLLPLTEAMGFRLLGAPSPHVDMVVSAAFMVSLVLLLHELVRRASGPVVAALVTLLLVTVPAFWVNADRAYADLPLALYLLAGGALLARWLDGGDRRLTSLVVAGCLLAFAMWVKREGTVVWLAGGLAVGLWTAVQLGRRRELVWRAPLAYLVPAAGLVPWLVVLGGYDVPDAEFAKFSLAGLVQHADRLPVLMQALQAQLLLVPSWGFVWLLILAAAVLRPPLASPGRAFALLAVAAHLAALTVAYVFSTWIPYQLHVSASIDRLVFQALPLGLYFLGTSITLAFRARPRRRQAAARLS